MSASLAQLARRLDRMERDVHRTTWAVGYHGLTVDVPTAREVMRVLYDAGLLNTYLASVGLLLPEPNERMPYGTNAQETHR